MLTLDRHNAGLVSIEGRKMSNSEVSESESDSDSSSNASSETLYTESFSSETSTAHTSDEEFIDDSSILDGFDAPRIPKLSQHYRTNRCQPRLPRCRFAGKGCGKRREIEQE